MRNEIRRGDKNWYRWGNGKRDKTRSLEVPPRLCDYLSRLGIDFLRHSRGRQRAPTISLLRHAISGRWPAGLSLGNRTRRAWANFAPVGFRVPACVSHLRRRLRSPLLGGAARSFGHRGRHFGYYSRIHGLVRDSHSPHAAPYSAAHSLASCGICGRRSPGESAAIARQSRRRRDRQSRRHRAHHRSHRAGRSHRRCRASCRFLRRK